LSVVDAIRHWLLDGPAVMRPAGVEDGVVVVVDGVVVVVVGGGVVVVVVDGVVVVVVPPPLAMAPPPPPPPPPPDVGALTTGVDTGRVVGEIEEIVDHRCTRPANWPLLDSDARVSTTSERTELESRPPKADAEASMFTKATRTLADNANVMSLGTRCVVFARKKFLSEPLFMDCKLADSSHTSTYEMSKVAQFNFRNVELFRRRQKTARSQTPPPRNSVVEHGFPRQRCVERLRNQEPRQSMNVSSLHAARIQTNVRFSSATELIAVPESLRLTTCKFSVDR
jgi:hypothetical protein